MAEAGLRVTVGDQSVDLAPGGHAEIGRSEACEVQVPVATVSRLHAVVWSTPDGWVFVDRTSVHGSWIDGQRVDRTLVTSPMRIRLGDPDRGPTLDLVPLVDGGTMGPSNASPPAVTTAGEAPLPTAGAFQACHATAGAPGAGAPSVIRIGRGNDNDIVIDDLNVSRHHAELHTAAGGLPTLIDVGSVNGTFVNGRRIRQAVIGELDLIGIGHSELRLVAGHLVEYVDTGEVTFESVRLTVVGRDHVTLVDEVSFELDERSLFGIVGPSGSGKSSLLAALSGLRPATSGRVLYGGRDLYGDYAELRYRIGLVPQEDVLHRELELRRALSYASRLRFPADVPAAERDERVDGVLAELGIAERASSPIHRLSGGERKRTNVAMELLTRPSLLLLDEPDSGLDPGLARVLMGVLRELADGGRTVVVVTHDISSLSLCDQILVMAPGGVPAYVGPPQDAPARFGRTDMNEVFTDLVTTTGTDWHVGREHTDAASPQAIEIAEAAAGRTAEADPGRPAGLGQPPRRQGWWSQLATLTERYIDVLASDRRNALLLVLQAPILGLLLLAALPTGELGDPGESVIRLVSAVGIVLFVLLVGATWLGANNAIREIARELPMYRRERAAGMSLSAYVVSKALVLGVLTVAQAVVLVALATARQRGPSDAVLAGWGPGELMVVVALAGVALMALALFISALAGSPERATSILPVVLILQLVLAAGVVLPEIVDKPVLNQLSLVSSVQWGVAGAASTVDLNELQTFDNRLRDLRTVDAADPEPAVRALTADPDPEGRWAHTRSAWLTAMGMLVLLTVLPLVGTGLALRRHDPGRS